MPPFKCSLVNSSYMDFVMAGKLWVPKCTELRIRNCCRSPHKKDVFLAFNGQLIRSNKDMGVTRIDQLTKAYMLIIISTLNPDHLYFKKDFLPAPIVKKKEEVYFDNTNQFLTGLPKLGLKTNGKANMVSKKKRSAPTKLEQWERL